MLAKSGLITPPCGVPSGVASHPLPVFHHLGFEVALNQFEHPSIADLLPYLFHQLLVRDAVEIAFDIRVDHPVVAFFQQLFDSSESISGSSSGTKAVTLCGKVSFKDRLDDVSEGCLDHSIPDHRYPQRPLLLAPWFGYPDPFDCRGSIALSA